MWMLILAMLLPSDPAKVRPHDPATYPARDSHAGLTVAAEAYADLDKLKETFGKYDYERATVLPVYFVFANTTKDAVRLDSMTVQIESPNGRRLPPIAGRDFSLRLTHPKQITGMPSKSPLPFPTRHKDPMVSLVLDQEFVVKMVPPGDTIGGFLYFDDFGLHPDVKGAAAVAGYKIYVNGLQWGSSGQELLFYELTFPEAPANAPVPAAPRKP